MIRATCAMAMLIVTALPATATTWVVDPGGTGDFPNIQAAINSPLVVSGDVIELTNGTFTGPGNRSIDFSGKAITVRSQSGSPSTCIIDLQGGTLDLAFGFRFASGETSASILEGVTIQGGFTPQGAGIDIRGSSPTIENSIIRSNRAANAPHEFSDLLGAGIYCGGNASPSITDCHILDNWCSWDEGGDFWAGGGLYCGSGATPVVSNCVLSGNSATYGGGIFCESSSNPSFSDCVISNNGMAPQFSWGGGMGVRNASATLRSCTFCDNFGWQGGDLWCDGSSPSLQNCTLVGALTDYAAVYCANGSSPTLSNTIITACMTLAVGCDGTGSPLLTCCDLFGNGGDWVDCVAGQAGVAGNISLDPLFCDPQCGVEDTDYSIRVNSPCAPGYNPNCGLVGAWQVGCEPVAVVPTTWGRIRAAFR